ncbi:MAG: thiol-disulfide oxidoreductase DCC family protein [Cyclobacteriaceae bacterium]
MDTNSEVNLNATDTIILFDGVCNLCDFFVNFVIDRDHSKKFKFASLQSDFASQSLSKIGSDHKQLTSLVLIDDGKISVKSSAALQILRQLGFPWKIFYFLIVIPRPIRDFIYDWIAKNRYKWFGKRDSCRVPTIDVMERFLDS